MKTKTINLYSFSELNSDAKQNAKDLYSSNFGYMWSDDAIESLEALAKYFGGKMTNYEIDWFNSSHSFAEFSMPELTKDEIKTMIAGLGSRDKNGRGNGDCVLTGYCADEDAIDGFVKGFRSGETDLETLMQSAFDTWLKACLSDCKEFYKDDIFSEHCDVNNYMFTEDGRLD